jgi:hypothetical protein
MGLCRVLIHICSRYRMKVLKHIFLYLVLYNVEQYQYLKNLDFYGQKCSRSVMLQIKILSSPWKNYCTFQQIYRPSTPTNLSSRATTRRSQRTLSHVYIHTHLWQFLGCTSVTLRLVVPYLSTQLMMTVLNPKIRTKLVTRLQFNKQFVFRTILIIDVVPLICHGLSNMTLIWHQ